jgi:hypothetical protein
MNTVTLPWPPTATSANKSKQGNWWEKSKAAKSYKAECTYLLKGTPKIDNPSGKPIPLVVTFHPPKNVKLDADNTYNRVKAAQDAVSDAVGVDDSLFWPVILCKGEKVAGGKVVFSFPDSPADIMRAIYPVVGTVS